MRAACSHPLGFLLDVSDPRDSEQRGRAGGGEGKKEALSAGESWGSLGGSGKAAGGEKEGPPKFVIAKK